MSTVAAFFTEILPAKLAENEDLAATIGAAIQFDIEGAGTWTLDCREGRGEVVEGAIEEPGCVIATSAEHWEQILENPMMATQFFMMGELTATDLGLAMQLQNILG
ncbi:MAG: SCP2 sterol-binding domain-containing protein [Pseudomonadota bacterium]